MKPDKPEPEHCGKLANPMKPEPKLCPETKPEPEPEHYQIRPKLVSHMYNISDNVIYIILNSPQNVYLVQTHKSLSIKSA